MKTLFFLLALVLAINTQEITINGPIKYEDYKTPDFDLIYPMVPTKEGLFLDPPKYDSDKVYKLCSGYSAWEGSINGGFTTLHFNFTMKFHDGVCKHILTVSSACLLYATEYKTTHALYYPVAYEILDEIIAPHFTIYCKDSY